VGADRVRRLEPVIAIGSTTAMALVAQGVVAVVPPRADFDSLADFVSTLASRAVHGTNGKAAANGAAHRNGGPS
jgi:uroporphyrinogen-III synthase